MIMKVQTAVKSSKPRKVYQDLRMESGSDTTTAPRNSKQVRNARYISRKEDRKTDDNLLSFADNIAALENRARAKDPFVRKVITGPGIIPSVFLYTDNQIREATVLSNKTGLFIN